MAGKKTVPAFAVRGGGTRAVQFVQQRLHGHRAVAQVRLAAYIRVHGYQVILAARSLSLKRAARSGAYKLFARYKFCRTSMRLQRSNRSASQTAKNHHCQQVKVRNQPVGRIFFLTC
jgi:hypothetical protein